MNASLPDTVAAAATPVYLVDNHGTLIIRAGDATLNLSPQDALELLKSVERTGYQAHANAVAKGGTA